MAKANNGASGKGNSGHQHDGQKNYQHSNQRNPDNIRNNTHDHQYNAHQELTKDVNLDADGKPKVDMELDDKN